MLDHSSLRYNGMIVWMIVLHLLITLQVGDASLIQQKQN
jgi:hypothetical protein